MGGCEDVQGPAVGGGPGTTGCIPVIIGSTGAASGCWKFTATGACPLRGRASKTGLTAGGKDGTAAITLAGSLILIMEPPGWTAAATI